MKAHENGSENHCDKKILIVDDEPDTCQLLSMLLTSRGYQTLVAYSGEEAVKCVRSKHPDLIILDVMMPGIDGWETFRQVHLVSNIPVVFLTAADSGDSAAQALRLGAKDYIRKPFHYEELLARVEVLLQESQAEAAVKRAPKRAAKRAVDAGRAWDKIQKPLVSVIIPTLNEARNLPLLLPYLPMNWIDEVILVDGRSEDDTVAVAKKLLPSIKVIMEKKKGKGVALQAGYKASSGDILVVIDADGSHDPREIPRYISALVEGSDFVKGSRFTPGGGTTDMPRYRKLGNAGFVHLVNLLYGAGFSDLCYGFHAFWRYCLDSTNLSKINGFEIDTAIYLEALASRLRIIEVPSFEGYRFYGKGKLETIPDGFRVLHTIFVEWFRYLRRRSEPVYIGFRGVKPDEQSSLTDLTGNLKD